MNENKLTLYPAATPSLWQKIKSCRRAYLFFAFLTPCLLMYAVYYAFGMYPLGDESVLVLDLNAQYVYFFGALRRAIFGDTSLIYSFFPRARRRIYRHFRLLSVQSALVYRGAVSRGYDP